MQDKGKITQEELSTSVLDKLTKNTCIKLVEGTDIDIVKDNGQYNGTVLLHMPEDSQSWWYIEVL